MGGWMRCSVHQWSCCCTHVHACAHARFVCPTVCCPGCELRCARDGGAGKAQQVQGDRGPRSSHPSSFESSPNRTLPNLQAAAQAKARRRAAQAAGQARRGREAGQARQGRAHRCSSGQGRGARPVRLPQQRAGWVHGVRGGGPVVVEGGACSPLLFSHTTSVCLKLPY